MVPAYPQGYNVADYLLEVASDPHVSLFQQTGKATDVDSEKGPEHRTSDSDLPVSEKGGAASLPAVSPRKRSKYATLFLTQLQVLSGREWKILRRWVLPPIDYPSAHSWVFQGTRRYFSPMCRLHQFSASSVVSAIIVSESLQYGGSCSTKLQVDYISIQMILSPVSNLALDVYSSW